MNLTSVKKGTYFEPKEITFGKYPDYWLENYAKPNTAERALELYNYIIEQHIKASLGNIKINHLHPSHLQEYYSIKLLSGKADGTGLSPQSVKHHHRLIHKVLKDAVKWQFLVRNIAEAVTPPKTKKAEMGAYLHQDYHKKGVMTEVLKTILPFVFNEFGLNRIVGDLFAENQGSKKFLEKLGFHQDGILRQTDFDGSKFHDTTIYSLLKEEFNRL